MAFPSAQDFARGWYTASGEAIVGERLTLFVDKWIPALSSESGGVPQIKTPAPDKSCEQQINALAMSQPEWAKVVGHHGLLKMLTACVAEQTGAAPIGFTQAVATELTPPWWKSPINLALIVALLGAGVYYYRKRKKR
jgi:hypothetical protein